MPRIKLTSAFCRDITCPPGQSKEVYRDTECRGFGIEVRASGGKTYWLYFQDAYGKVRQHRLGGYNDLSFNEANKLAKRLRAEIATGGDPAARKAEKRAIPFFEHLAQQHVDYAKTYQKSWQTIEMTHRVHTLPRWGKERVDTIRQQDIAKWLAKKREEGLAPASVERLRIVFNRAWELAIRWGTPGVKMNPVRGIPRPKIANARDRFLSSAEAARLLKATEASANPQLRNIVGLLLLTGARKNELLHAKWQDVDLERRVWFLPTSKTGRSRHIPLSQPAVDIINKLPRWENCPWLIACPRSRKPYTDIKHPWQTARKAAGLDGLHIHDLRHSAASFMVNAGIDLFAVGRILGHADHQSTMRYAHLANDTLMKAVEAGATKMNVDWALSSTSIETD